MGHSLGAVGCMFYAAGSGQGDSSSLLYQVSPDTCVESGRQDG